MSASLTKFRLYYPEFAGVSDDDVSTVIEDCSAEFIPATWGTLYLRGLLALSAHVLAMRARSASAAGAGGAGTGSAPVGGVASLKTGDLSVSFGGGSAMASGGGMASGDAIYTQTPYGLEYLRLRGRLGLAPLVY